MRGVQLLISFNGSLVFNLLFDKGLNFSVLALKGRFELTNPFFEEEIVLLLISKDHYIPLELEIFTLL